MQESVQRSSKEINDAISLTFVKLFWLLYGESTTIRETSLEMIAVTSTVNRTTVIAVELGKVNGFLRDSEGRAKRW